MGILRNALLFYLLTSLPHLAVASDKEHATLLLMGRVEASHTVNAVLNQRDQRFLLEHISNNSRPLLVQMESEIETKSERSRKPASEREQRELHTELLRTGAKLDLSKYFKNSKRPTLMKVTIVSPY